MTGLERNRVFDIPKLDLLRSVGTSLLDTGVEVCKAWDEAVGELRELEGVVPGEIRSPKLAYAIRHIHTPLSQTDYEKVRMQLDYTLMKLEGNLPTCDQNGAAAVKHVTAVTYRSSEMLEELKQYVNVETLSLELGDYEKKMEAYRADNKKEEPDISELSEQAETILKGLPEFTSFDGDPVNMETGNFVYQYTDLQSRETNLFSFTRSYNAMDRNKGVLGRGWFHNWEMQLLWKEDTIVLLHEDGREEHFAEKNGRYVSNQNNSNMLLEIGEHYYFTGREREVRIFDKSGRFIRLQQEDGGVTLTYDEEKLFQVTQDTGMFFRLDYDAQGRLVKLEDEAGRCVSYGYDGKKLTEITDPVGNTYLYSYGKNGKLLEVKDKRGVIILSNEYDTQKRIVSQQFPDGSCVKMEYLKDGQVRVTERNGSQITYVHDEKHRNTETIYEDGKELRCYDEKDRTVSHTDKKGNKTVYQYDETGRKVNKTDAIGHQTSREYDEEGRPIREVRADGGEMLWRYDGLGRLVERIDPEGHKLLLSYRKEERRPYEICLADGSRLRINYDKRGNILAIDYPDGTGMSYRYDILGRVVESSDKKGNTTRFAYDAMNRITEVVRADGLHRSYRYNEMGEALEIRDFDGYSAYWEYNELNKPRSYTDKCGRETRMEYDRMWNLSKITDPEGGVTEYIYDRQNHLEKVTKPGGSSVRFVYDANGNRTEIHYPDGTVKRYEYDALNRRTAEIDEAGNRTSYIYDCMGNVSRIVDRCGNETSFVYDKNGRKLKQTDGAGAVTRYTYTPLGKPETITDPEGRITYYHYDGGG
ncbi:MAG: RHS repeat protein, partial [Lachnospiraceae bacterium]|nr:RHS repeat protein [Lachnospiraceae bacterium]